MGADKEHACSGGFYIIDGNSQAYRSFYAIPELTAADGVEVNAVFGFFKTIIQLMKNRKPGHIALVFDYPAPTFRHKIYADYKAQREKMPESLRAQMKIIKETARRAGMPVYEKEGYEADDIMAGIALKAAEKKHSVFIMSSDKDMAQVLGPRVSILKIGREGEKVITPAKYKEENGVPHTAVADVLALMGDSSDNIPGVRGIGEKTAFKLIAQYGSVEKLISELDTVKPERVQKLIKEGIESLKTSRQLAEITNGSDAAREAGFSIPDCDVSRIDIKALNAEFLKYNFKSLITDSGAVRNAASETRQAAGPGKRIKTLAKEPCVFFIGEEAAPDFVISARGGEVSFAEHSGFSAGKTAAITNSSKNMYKAGYGGGGLADITLMAYLLNPEKAPGDIAHIFTEHLGGTFLSYGEIAGRGAKKKKYAEVPEKELSDYAAALVGHAPGLKSALEGKLEEAGLMPVYKEIEEPLSRVLAVMEKTGVKIDSALLGEIAAKTGEKVKRAERRVFEETGAEFNLNSPKQLADVLFDRLGIKPEKKTKTGYSTDNEVLTKIKKEHPAVAHILEYRMYSKLKSGFIDVIGALIDRDAMIYPEYNQSATATGRLSASNPNIQNIPVRGEEGRELRKLFVPLKKGDVLLKADYSQIELRILACMAKEKKLVKAFNGGADIHAMTASALFGLPEEFVSADHRRAAKVVNFSIIYGKKAFGLSRDLDIPVHEAADYINRFFEMYPGVKKYQEDTVEQARKDGFVTTMLGRRRYMGNIKSANRTLREFAERAAINAPIQGTAADIIKKAMISIQAELERSGSGAKMVLQVHDELVFSVPRTELPEIRKMVTEKMEGAVKAEVKFTVSAGEGGNWYACG